MTTKTNSDGDVVDIYLVGLGVVSVAQMTREVEQAISTCQSVFFIDTGPFVEDHLKSLCPKVFDLMNSYRIGESRIHAYDRMSSAVIDAALAAPPVAFATYGHPRLYVHPTQQITEASSHLGLRCRVLPGVSTVDVILCELGLDPGYHGLQMYEANDAMMRNRPLQSDVPCLVLQVGTLETGLACASASKPARFRRFIRYLSQFYPETHPVTLVTVSNSRLRTSRIFTFPLCRMENHADDFSLETTLYIPPARLRPVVYEEMLRDFESKTYLSEITYPDRNERT